MSLAIALLVLVLVLGAFGILVEGHRAIPRLEDVEPRPAGTPRVSIVFAARDEAHGIERAARSLLAQAYPELEVVAVDDRSTDGTGEALDRLARVAPGLRVVHLRELPAGWLGKTHGLARGAQAATGELLLFTDGDVVLEPTTVARAVALLEARGVDHLAVGPEVEVRGVALALVMNFFVLGFAFFQRPWRAVNPRSADHIGIGAFNLVRRAAYERAGGHERVRLRPDDDVKLGKALKQSEARQLFASGRGFVRVEWYRSVREMTSGLRKNSFAGFEYRLSSVIGGLLVLLAINVLPFVMAFVAGGVARLVWIASCLLLMWMYAATAAQQRNR
ncbi:MAG TPA: glycosyltransferase family 2 protein, partial [Gemmatimonadaceae bacterium]|nr:glycosyltransferase family 2 protein [Gemmatimonadaceae bacterium]